jgi:hypothetical protein
MANVKGAAADPQKKKAFEGAAMGLTRLGLTIEAIAASGSGIADLDRAMSEAKWTQNQRFVLKANLAAIGAVEK